MFVFQTVRQTVINNLLTNVNNNNNKIVFILYRSIPSKYHLINSEIKYFQI